MAEQTPVPYEVAFVYDCQCCKKGHTEFGRITQPGVAVTHREELKWRLLELVKEKFSESHSGEKFDIGNLVVEEFVDGNKIEVDPQTIQPKEVKGEDLTKPPGKKVEKPSEEEPLEEMKKPEAQARADIGSIKKMLEDRVVAIKKREKEIDAEIEKSSKELVSLTKELADLEKMLAAAKEQKSKTQEKKK